MGSSRYAAMRHVRTLFEVGTVAGLTDGQLLERFAAYRGEGSEAAFSALVERHGPMVLRVCRAALRDEHEAQDAFQATFLVLVRKARALWVRDSLGPWLFAVAGRVAAGAKAGVARRRAHERRATERRVADVGAGDWDDIGPALFEEVGRLPARFREPVVLCYVEGRTYEEAARHLRCPVGTVKSRLASGRERLRVRLTRRGLAPSVGLLGTTLSVRTASAALPIALIRSTARNAVQYAAGRVAAGIVPASVLSLMEGTLKSLSLTGGKSAAVLLVGLVIAGTVGSVRPVREGATGTAPKDNRIPAPSSFSARVDRLPGPLELSGVAGHEIERSDGTIPPPAARAATMPPDGPIPPPAARHAASRIDGPIPPPAGWPAVMPPEGPIPPPAARPDAAPPEGPIPPPGARPDAVRTDGPIPPPASRQEGGV